MKTIVVGYDETEPANRALGRAAELHREELQHAAAFLAERGIEGEYDVALGDPADHIIHLAEQRAADLIVVGTRKPGLIERMLGLRVSRAVQRKAHCDVLIVH